LSTRARRLQVYDVDRQYHLPGRFDYVVGIRTQE
jgi:hypothetical protein